MTIFQIATMTELLVVTLYAKRQLSLTQMKHNVSDIVSGQMDNIIKAPVVDRGHTEHYLNKRADNLQGRVTIAATIMYGLS